VAWARQYLVWEGLLDGSKRGVWTLTTVGSQTSLSDEQSRALFLKWVQLHQEARRAAQDESAQTGAVSKADTAIVPIPEDEVEEAQLLGVLRALSPSGFERVCQRLLRESGFERVGPGVKPRTVFDVDYSFFEQFKS
jgi:restriction system protein